MSLAMIPAGAGVREPHPTQVDMAHTSNCVHCAQEAPALDLTGRRLMTAAEVAELLAVHPSTLSRWRKEGGGPEEIRDALLWLTEDIPRYRRQEVLAFVSGEEVAA